MVNVALCVNNFSLLRDNRRGASAFEFALTLPVFLLMMCGTLQYGVLFYTWNVALNCTRNAARAVAVGRVDAAGAETMMRNNLPPWVTNSSGSGEGVGNEGDVIITDVTDAAVGSEVVSHLEFPATRATFLPLAPMPENVTVTVRMVKEA